MLWLLDTARLRRPDHLPGDLLEQACRVDPRELWVALHAVRQGPDRGADRDPGAEVGMSAAGHPVGDGHDQV